MSFSLILLCLTIGYASAAPRGKLNNEPVCGGKPAEIYFLLDSSSSIWSVDFKLQLQFVLNVTEIFDISPSQTRVGVSSFSYRYHENIALDAFSNKDDLQQAIKKIRQVFGGTYTYDALDGLRTSGFKPEVVRNNVSKIAIVITDGESHNEEKTVAAAKRLKESGVVVFAVGVGSKTDINELRAIASEPTEQYLFETKSYGLLPEIKDQLTIKTCEVHTIKDEPKGPACGATNLADIMFLANPAELGANNMQDVYSFMADVSKDFNTESGNIRVGLESRNCGAHNITLGSYENREDMVKQFRNTQIPGLAHMIKRLRTHAYTEENGGRTHARHMAVLFVDDKLYNAKDVLNEARRTKLQDVELFVIAIGDSVVDDELQALSSSAADTHYMKVASYADLKGFKPEFLEKFCKGL